MFILRYIAGWDVYVDPIAADVNGDGKISSVDAMYILRYVAGWDIEYFN